MRAHIIENGLIVNTIEVVALDAFPDLVLVDADAIGGTIGDTVDGETLMTAPPPPLDRAVVAREIDDAVAAVYVRFTRFQPEYEAREAQAQAYKAAGYTGDVPQQVAAFATPAAMDPQAATDLILSQAAQLRGGLAQLGVQRMRKYEVLRASTDDAARAAFDDVTEQVAAVARALP